MQMTPFSRVKPVLILSTIALGLALTACGGDDEETPSVSSVTPVATLVVIPTADTSPTVADGVDNMAANGEAIFAKNGCAACHSTAENRIFGPGLAGIGETAAIRVTGQSADEYLSEAIRDPGAFLVDGYPDAMPGNFGSLPEKEITDLIAFLKSL